MDGLTSIRKTRKQVLTANEAGQYRSLSIPTGLYTTFYLDRAYYVNDSLAEIPVVINVTFGNSITQMDTDENSFSDGKGVVVNQGFGYIKFDYLNSIVDSPDIVVEYTVSNGTIIDNAKYISGNLNVNVVNFPEATSSAVYTTEIERAIEDKAIDKLYIMASENQRLKTGLNLYKIYTGENKGSYIETDVKTVLQCHYNLTPPNSVSGKIMNSIVVTGRVRLSDHTAKHTLKILARINDGVWELPFEPKYLHESYGVMDGVNRYGLEFVYKFTTPVKITGNYFEIEILNGYRTIVENSDIKIGVNII